MRKFSNVFNAMTGEVSVSPYPSMMRTPALLKNSAISRARGAPPDTKKRSLPPTRASSFLNTNARATRRRAESHPLAPPASEAVK